jgi:hypothetical protein
MVLGIEPPTLGPAELDLLGRKHIPSFRQPLNRPSPITREVGS